MPAYIKYVQRVTKIIIYQKYQINLTSHQIILVFLVDLKVNELTQPGEVGPKKFRPKNGRPT